MSEMAPFRLPLSEMLYLRRFFDGVDYAVSRELGANEVAYEEFLSPLLGRLLDSRSGFQALLRYPLRALNADLNACGSESGLKVEFETTEHSKGFSGSTSHADLGIVFRYENQAFNEHVEKAVLVECKRLYPVSGTYKLRSRYEGFDAAQFSALTDFDNKHGNGVVFYFLYNPLLDAFEQEDAKLIRAIETRSIEHGLRPDLLPPHVYFSQPSHEYHRSGRSSILPVTTSRVDAEADSLREEVAEAATRRPGLKAVSLGFIGNTLAQWNRPKIPKPTLLECYRYNEAWLSTGGALPFMSLSTFLVDSFMSCFRGSSDSRVVDMASGRDPDPHGPPNAVTNVLARHSLRITLTSHLPFQEGLLG